MANPVRVTINGPEDLDAPTVDDLLGQIGDFISVLREVEAAVGPDWSKSLVWRVTDATMNSPISFEFTPFGEGPAAEVTARAALIEETTIAGLRSLRTGNAHPPFFTPRALSKARRIHTRVLNGLSDTVISFGDPDDTIIVDPTSARKFEAVQERAKALSSIPYRELGSVEGYVTKPELDGHGRAILRFKARLGGEEVKAYASGDAFHDVEALRLSDVWHGLRVRVHGTIHYKKLGMIEVINATSVEVLDREPLPAKEDIVDPSFTGGIQTEDYLRELRA